MGPAAIDVAGFRESLPGAPIVAYVGRPPKAGNADDWAAAIRQETQHALAAGAAGAAGIGLFYFFTCRGQFEPPFAVLKDLLER